MSNQDSHNTTNSQVFVKSKRSRKAARKIPRKQEKIPNAPPENVEEMFLKRDDYSNENKDIKAKSLKYAVLKDLRKFLANSENFAQYVTPHFGLIFDMIKKNIFRPLPINKKGSIKLEPGETATWCDEDIFIDQAWPPLQEVYQLFLEIIEIDIRHLKLFITSQFIQDFLQLFDSGDPKEQEYAKQVLHKLYGKLLLRRKIIRRAISDFFLALIHENQRINGISEILNSLALIISGYAVPCREEHIVFFYEVIIPLHKVQTVHVFHEELLHCAMNYLSKDNSLAIPLIKSLLRYWPFGNSVKELLYLDELLKVLEVCEIEKLEPIIPKLFKRLVRCISGPQLQVADRIICFFENDCFLSILCTFKKVIFPIAIPTIEELARTHWNEDLQYWLNELKEMLRKIDFALFYRALDTGSRDLARSNSLCIMHNLPLRAATEGKWDTLAARAKAIDPRFKVPCVPYIDSHVVGLNNMNGIMLTSQNLIPST